MEKFSEKSCVFFSEELASRRAVPGGGGVAAMVGALGTALCSMVGNHSVGKEKYAEYEEDLQRMLLEGDALRRRLMKLVDEDAAAFAPLQKAFALPKEDNERAAKIAEYSMSASEVPFTMMRYICQTINLLEEMEKKGNRGLLSDIGCGALCCKAALESAAMNVFINTKNLDYALVASMESDVDNMLKEYLPRADKLADKVMKELRR